MTRNDTRMEHDRADAREGPRGLVLVLRILAVALVRRGHQGHSTFIGVTLGTLVSLYLLGLSVYLFSPPLNSPEADPRGPVEVVPPPKRNPPPPESILSSEGHTVSAEPTSWCKYVRSTMFCEGHEVLPLPPFDETLEVPFGTTLLFDYGGTENLKTRPNGMAPSDPPLHVGGVDLGDGWETRDGPEGLEILEDVHGSGRALEEFGVKRLGERADNRFSIDRKLPVGDYVIQSLVRMPRGEAYYYFRLRVVPEEARPRGATRGLRRGEMAACRDGNSIRFSVVLGCKPIS